MEGDKELAALFRPVEMTEAEKEFRAWIKKNHQSLSDRDPYEVAHLALTCGFEEYVVYSVLASFNDAMRGQHVERRAELKAWELDEAVRVIRRMTKDPALDLTPLWDNVIEYQTGERPERKAA